MPEPRPSRARRASLGAQVLARGGVSFRVWAPRAESVAVERYTEVGPMVHPLEPSGGGYHEGVVREAREGTRYRYRLDDGLALPDPASRSQPEGPHGPSEVVDPRGFGWSDQRWPGLPVDGLVLYELHVGTFSAAGTFEGVIPHLPELVELGVSAIELMPVAEFPGRWNWGYDGVGLFAPCSTYGGPAGLRRLIDAAHRAGLGVLLDVVYNHLGPDGNYLALYSADYFTGRYQTPWGEALNFDGPASGAVRELVLENARAWLEEYHLDGLRLDATHAIFDASPRHILAEIAEQAHAGERPALIFAEDQRNLAKLVEPAERGGFGLDGVWADDFHHALHTYLTGEREGYYRDFSGRLADVAQAIESGFLDRGPGRTNRGKVVGSRTGELPAHSFVFCIQNHDQIGNRALGERLNHLIDHQRYLLATVALLCCPHTLLLFQGQEFAATTPFLYFTDHEQGLGQSITEGRRREFRAFSAFADPASRERIPNPQAESTYQRSRLDFSQREEQAEVYQTYRLLLGLRRDDPVMRRADRQSVRAWTVGAGLLLIHRWAGAAHRLALLNFGDEAVQVEAGQLAGVPSRESWRKLWGSAEMAVTHPAPWTIEGRSGALLAHVGT